jgi:electron transfer flavoprotein alpha subunit
VSMEIFAVAEHSQGELASVSVELLHLANAIKGSGTSNAIVFGRNAAMSARNLSKYADKVWAVEDEQLENCDPEVCVDIICQILTGKNRPLLILVGDTPSGKELAPSLAVELGAPVQTDVVGVTVSDVVRVTKYIFQGKAMVDMEMRKSECYVVTVRQKVFKDGPEVSGEVELVPIRQLTAPRRKFVRCVEPEKGEVDISAQDVLVTVGKGIGDRSTMQIVEELAQLLGGATAGSRPIIDLGWLPKDRQVGSSGKTVSPKLYVGLGVSGASQHVMGMKDSELIIAVNKDPDAPIFAVAEYGIPGDIHEILPELVSQLRGTKG